MSFKVDLENNIILIYNYDFIDENCDYEYKNIIFDMTTLKPIGTQYNQIIIGKKNIIEYLKNNKYDKIIMRECYEGTQLTIFYHNNKWFVCTKKCLDAHKSKWNDTKSHYDMLNEILKEYEITLDNFNKDYVYNINLIHYENNRNIGGDNFKDVKLLDLLYVSEKETLKVIDSTKIITNNISEMFITDEDMCKEEINYTSLDDIQKIIIDNIKELDKYMENNKSDSIFLQREGKIFEFYNNGIPAVGKIQTPLYEYLYHHPCPKQILQFPKYDILHLKYVLDKCKELHIKPDLHIQKLNKEKVFEDLIYDLSKDSNIINNLIQKYFTEEQIKNSMINIHYNMKNLAFLIKDVYFTFLNQNENYEKLPNSYKCIKYVIHGVYKKMLENNSNNEKLFITPDIIYNTLLTYNIHCIKELLLDYSTTTKLLYTIRDKKTNSYNYIQYPIYIMKKQIKSNKNNKKKINKIPSQYKKPNSTKNYMKNKSQNNMNKNNNRNNMNNNKNNMNKNNQNMSKNIRQERKNQFNKK